MKPGFARINLPYFMDDVTVHFVLEAVDMVATHGWKLLPQYRFDPHTGSWENRHFTEKNSSPPYSLHDVIYDEIGLIIRNTTGTPSEYDVKLDEVAQSASRVLKEAAELNKEINTNDDFKVEFNDDKNQLIWFLQPHEAQFYLAAETLKHKPHTFVRTKLPFKPRSPTSRVTRPKWPQIYEIQEYLSRRRASEVGVESLTKKPDVNNNTVVKVRRMKEHKTVRREAWKSPDSKPEEINKNIKKRSKICSVQ